MKVHNQGKRSSLVRHTHLNIIFFVNFEIIIWYNLYHHEFENLGYVEFNCHHFKNVTSVYLATSNVLFRQNKLTTVHT